MTLSFGSIGIYDPNMFIACYDTSGTALWARGAKGMSSYNVYGNSVVSDRSGNVYTTGYSFEDQDINFGSITLQGHNAYVAKYNSSGNLQWVKGIADNSDDAAFGLILDTFNNIYVCGSFNGWGTFGSETVFTQGSDDVFIEKLDSSGNYIWSVYGGGNGGDAAYGIAFDNNSNLVLTGYISGNATFGSYSASSFGDRDLFVTKFSRTTGIPITAGKDKQLYIYPNPANDMLYIKGLKETTGYKIVSITGATLQEGVITKNSNAIDIQGLSPGIYLLYAAGEVHKIVKD
jgi:hypothetical protein